MASVFDAPIPGQSLTDEPRNHPWERPPEISDPEEAIDFHINHLNKTNVMDNLLQVLQLGVPLAPLAKTIVTKAQMDGIHSVDVGLIVLPVVQEELKAIAEDSGIPFKMGDGDDEETKQRQREEEVKALVLERIKKLEGTKEDDEGVDLMRDVASGLGGMEDEMPVMEEETEAMPMEGEAPMEEQQPQMEQEAPVRSGLMARG